MKRDKNSPPFIIDTALQLPCDIIDLKSASDEHFVFRFLKFDEKQTDYSVQKGGVTGQFGIEYHGRGMDCAFSCDITMGNVYDFFHALDDSYDGMDSGGPVTLCNYGADERTLLRFSFPKPGRIRLDGKFMNKDDQYQSGIVFGFDIDQSYIPDIINAAQTFFDEIHRIQGHYTFL